MSTTHRSSGRQALAIALLALGCTTVGCGGGGKSNESASDASVIKPTVTTPATTEVVKSCLQKKGLSIEPPPDSTGVDVGATPIFIAAFPDSEQSSQIYVVGSEDEAKSVESKAIDAVKVFGVADAEDYFVQVGNAVATFEDENAKPTDEQKKLMLSCLVG